MTTNEATLKTEQELFWEGNFGDEYAKRNSGADLVSASLVLFGRIFRQTEGVKSVLELGANIGLNLTAIHALLPKAALTGVEINKTAAAQLRATLPTAKVHETSILDFKPAQDWDLIFTKGVLIHINPEKLPDVYDLMYQRSRRYIMVCEYYNPAPVEIPYRGHAKKLFKRDFAGELLDRFNNLRLVDYGFTYHRDPLSDKDDMNWFLLEKKA